MVKLGWALNALQEESTLADDDTWPGRLGTKSDIAIE